MPHPTVTQKAPYPVEVEAGKSYVWCACGLSSKQPFCDGTHKASGMAPLRYTSTKDGTVYFCGCKHAINKPLCDGTHGKI